MTTGFDGCCACLPWWASFGGGVVSCYWHPRRWTPHRPTTAAMTVAAAAAECSVVFYSGGGPIKCLTTTTSTWKKKSLHRTGRWMMRRTKHSIRTTSDCRLIQRPTWLRYSGLFTWIYFIVYYIIFSSVILGLDVWLAIWRPSGCDLISHSGSSTLWRVFFIWERVRDKSEPSRKGH